MLPALTLWLAVPSFVVVMGLVVLAYFGSFYVARRIGRRKGLSWFWWAFFLHWLGVLILALRSPKPWAATEASRRSGSSYHMPPGLPARAQSRDSTLYGKRRG